MLKWLWLSLLAIILDQGSKIAVDSSMQLYESIPVMPGFNLTYVHNTGAAFSFLSEAGGWQRWFFCRTGSGDQCGHHDLAGQAEKT
jgi:signal peptidase II